MNQRISESVRCWKWVFIYSLIHLFTDSSLASQFHCRWNFTDFTVTGIGVKQVKIQTIAPYGVINSNLITGDLRTFQAGSDGSLTVSNLANGRSYRVTFVGPTVSTVITNNFDTNVTGLVNGVDYLAAPLRVDGATIAYSQVGADARFHNVAGDTSTNAAFRGLLLFPDGAVIDYVWTVTNATTGAGAWRAAAGGGGGDATAIHDNVAGEIAAVADKATPVVGDHLLIEDSAASDAKKHITIGSLETALEGVMDLQDLQGAATDGQIPNNITIDLATTATTANAGDSATAFFSSGTLEDARLSSNVGLKNGANNFTGVNSFNADVVISNEVALTIGGYFIIASSTNFSINIGSGPVEFLAHDANSDTTTFQEKVAIQEQLTVQAGQDGYAIAQTGGGSNYFTGHIRSTSNIVATAFSGDGSALTGVNASTVTVVDSTDASSSVAIFDSATGNLAAKTDAGLTYNASSGTLTATAFSGPLTGNVTGNVTGNADTATLASTVTVVDGTDATSFVGIFDSATGSLAAKTDAALTYDASTGAFAATSVSGSGSGLTALNDDNVNFDDADSVWTATAVGPALEELNDSINSGSPNGTGAKVHWSQLLGVPAGFADNSDDGSGGGGVAVAAGTNGISLTTNAGVVTVSFNGTPDYLAGDTMSLNNLNTSNLFVLDGIDASHSLKFFVGSDLTVNRIWNIQTGDASRTNTIRGNGTFLLSGDTLTGDVTATFDTDGSTVATIADSVTVTGWELGASTATTPAANDNDTSLATTAYVQSELTAYASDTVTFTGKTLDASATGNVLKFKSYLQLSGFDNATGALPTNTNDMTAVTFMRPVFLNGTDAASNFIEWHLIVPEDVDTAVDLRAKLKFRLTAADTGTHRYVLSMHSIADSASFTGTPANAVNLDFAGDASGASGDVESVGYTTLTGWAGAVTAGQHWVIRLARDGDTSDTSTVDSMFGALSIEYGATQ